MVPTAFHRPLEPPSLDLLECLFDYAGSYFRLRNFSAATRRGYLSDQLLFVRYLKATWGISRVTSIERDHIVGYLSQAERRDLRGTTRARKLGALRSFFSYLEEVGRIPASPVRDIPRPRQEAGEPRVLIEGEYERLRAVALGNPRSRAVVELFLQTGIRLSEASKLTTDDVGLSEAQGPPAIGWLRVRGKGRKERTITLNSRACEALWAYLGTRADCERGAPLFLSRKSARLSSRAVDSVVPGRSTVTRATITLRLKATAKLWGTYYLIPEFGGSYAHDVCVVRATPTTRRPWRIPWFDGPPPLVFKRRESRGSASPPVTRPNAAARGPHDVLG